MLIDDGTGGLTREAIGIAIALHRKYGPSLKENAYLRPFVIDLRAAGHQVVSQRSLDLVHAGVSIPNAYRPFYLISMGREGSSGGASAAFSAASR